MMDTNFVNALREMAQRDAERPLIRQQGIAALERLFTAAQGFGGQSKVVTMFLLGLYDGEQFPFDMTEFRCLDPDVFDDCLAVLRLDSRPEREVHQYLQGADKVFQKWSETWSGKTGQKP